LSKGVTGNVTPSAFIQEKIVMSESQKLRVIERLLCRLLHKRFGYGEEPTLADDPCPSHEIDLLLTAIHELHIEDEQRQGNPVSRHNRCHREAWLKEDPYEVFDALITEEEAQESHD
jgi:hypothetical protein